MYRILLISLLLLLHCAKESSQKNYEKIHNGDRVILSGEISVENLYDEFPDWEKNALAYYPDTAVISRLQNITYDFSAEVFLGTWCSDSEREVPRFLKIWQEANLNEKGELFLYTLGRDKESKNGLSELKSIKFVPTFIFYKNDKEIGRIVEEPAEILEKDISNILLKNE
ncbi:MAG: thioredoxin family protein [Calditrichaceae bacterium]|nr:thioredoxin family protein [Calditrichaceae bacterium]MBN2708837.1 thioredoxin family protein [Calditrichaceae bacterium]RQV97636.1 MAG: thioredoxin [Calditrichota bacterium]